MRTGKNMVFHLYKIRRQFKHLISFNLDSSGQVFSIDLLFALVLIAIVMGMSANAMDMAGNKITAYSAGKSLDRIAVDVADIMINTPGPEKWEEGNNSLVTPGLAVESNLSINSSKILSLKKINKLQSHYDELMANILPLGGNSSLTIEPSSQSMGLIIIGNNTPSNKVSEVAVVNRTVLVNYRDYKVLLTIDTTSQTDLCPHGDMKNNHNHQQNSTPVWKCKSFKVSKYDLNTTDFYLLTDPTAINDNQACWMLDCPDNITEDQNMFTGNPILINDKINNLIGDEDEIIIWAHILTSLEGSNSFITYLIAVPRGTAYKDIKIEYLNPQPCYFILKIWLG